MSDDYDAFKAWTISRKAEIEADESAAVLLADFRREEPLARAAQLDIAKRRFGWSPPEFEKLPKHGLILADPAWAYDQFRASANGAVVSAYDPHSMAGIAGLRVGDRWAAEDCVLVLWVTGMVIVDGHLQHILREWGFVGRSICPWLKNSPTTKNLATTIGIWLMGCAEYVVFATRGKIGGFFEVHPKLDKYGAPVLDANGRPKKDVRRVRHAPLGCLVGDRDDPRFWYGPSAASQEQQAGEIIAGLEGKMLVSPKVKASKSNAKHGTSEKNHSKKPETLREYCETFAGPYLELYARTRRSEKWSAWGYETGFELGPEFGVRPYTKKEET